MDFDPVMLARFQFAFTIMFHYLFPPLTIGLGVLLVFMEANYLATKNPLYEAMTKFWVKIFGLVFAMGVATGIVMEFQFGTNWASYSRYVGDVFGSVLAAEGIFAFFLESGFLAILLFGWDKVGPKMHFFATVMVALGSIFSAIWIIVAVSWMQTPAGFHIVMTDVGPRAELTDWLAVLFNPSSVVRLLHTLVGAFILGAFFVMSISAYYLLKGRHLEFARRSFRIALVMGTACSLLQLPLGHWSAHVVSVYQPAKLAAMEGLFETKPYAALTLFGIPNVEERRVDYEIAVPGMLSALVHFDPSVPVQGLDQVPREDWAPVGVTFQSYHMMVALGFFFIGVTLLASFLWWRGMLFQQRWLLWIFVFAVVGPYIANQTGWVTAEVGRQPWIVWGLMRTAEGVSRTVSAGEIIASLVMFGSIYALLFALFIYVLDRKIRGGPEPMGAHDLEGTTPDSLLDAASRRGKRKRHMLDEEREDL